MTGQFAVAGDIDVGQTSAVAGATATGNGNLVMERIGSLSVVGDLDVGQTGSLGTPFGVVLRRCGPFLASPLAPTSTPA